jgi:hypothetical protein
MATCGYLCPLCEGKGFKEDGSDCEWCMESKSETSTNKDIEEWIEKVHQGPCCSDPVKEEEIKPKEEKNSN